MVIGRGSGAIWIRATGGAPVEFVDDVFTESSHRLAPGSGLVRRGRNGDGWEGPTPLPSPMPGPEDPGDEARSESGKQGDEWEGPIELAALAPRELEIDQHTLDFLARGGTVKVNLLRSPQAFKLSHLGPLNDALARGEGHLVVELGADG